MKKGLLLAAILAANLAYGQQIKGTKVAPDNRRTLSGQKVTTLDKSISNSTTTVVQTKGVSTNNKPTERRCFTTEAERIRRERNPQLPTTDQFEQWMSRKVEEVKKLRANPGNRAMAAAAYTIPVIVHIVHNGEAVGEGANISAAQAYSQIQVLNEDFRRTNADKTDTRAEFVDRAADFEIEFVLATHDEDGNRLAEPGIVRHNLGRSSWDTYDAIETVAKPSTIWNTAKYCNMWTINFGGDMAGTLGYAEFPAGSSLPGMPTGSTASTDTDGLVMGYPYFGSSDKDTYGTFTLSAPYDLGRTATHEIGHWLGLRHIWGDGGCAVDDYVNDTPTAANSNGGCPAATTNSCNSGAGDELDMTENYMDYTNDACMNMFTEGQKARAIAVMTSSPNRAELPSSDVYTPTYDDAGVTGLNYDKDCSGNISGQIYFTNYATSQDLSYLQFVFEVDGSIVKTMSWSGTVTALGTDIAGFSGINIGTGEHTVKVYTQSPNYNTDENTANDAYAVTITTNISGDYAQDFEGGSGSYPELQIVTGSESGAGVSSYAANSGVYGLYFEGNSATGYPAAGSGPSETEAFTTANSHFASAILCYDGSTASALRLSFDYKLNYAINAAYTNFRYRVVGDNGTPYSSGMIQPTGGVDKAWSTVTLNLDSYVGGDIQVIFEANCKYPQANVNGVEADGNAVFIDNIQMTYATSLPEISFVSTAGSVNESAATSVDGCRNYTDYTAYLKIANASSTGATVQLNASGTSRETADYELLTSSVTFAAGSTTNQPVVIRVYDDYDVESDETVELSVSLNSGSDALIASSANSFTLTLQDNDVSVGPDVVTQTLINEDFSGGLTNWTTVYFENHNINSSDAWRSGTRLSFTGYGNAAYVTRGATQSTYQGNRVTDTGIKSSLIDATNLSNIQISFNIAVDGETSGGVDYDYAYLYYELASDPGNYYPLVGSYVNTGGGINVSGTLTGFDGEQFYLVWTWTSDASNAGSYSVILDNISLTGDLETRTIATTLGSEKNFYFGPYQTVHFYDETDSKLIATLQNNSVWDYGCTTVTIDREGNSAKEFWNSGTAQAVTDKSVTVTPTNNTLVGGYTITLYYAEEEVAGWEAYTGNSRNNIQLAKVSGATVSQVSPGDLSGGTGNVSDAIVTSFGSDVAISATFTTGFSSFAAGMPGDPPVVLPVNLYSFEGKMVEEDAVLDWVSATEENVSHYEVEYSRDGENFEYLTSVEAAGESEQMIAYDYTHKNRAYGFHYYRLKMVDLDATYEYSKRISVFQSETQFGGISLYPNPAPQGVAASLKLSADRDELVQVEVFTLQGVKVGTVQYEVAKGANKISLPTNMLKSGMYLIQLTNSSQQKIQQKLLIK